MFNIGLFYSKGEGRSLEFIIRLVSARALWGKHLISVPSSA